MKAYFKSLHRSVILAIASTVMLAIGLSRITVRTCHAVSHGLLLALFAFIILSGSAAFAQSAPTISPPNGAYASQPNNGTQKATIGGTITASDVITITVFDIGLTGGFEEVSYTVTGMDTLTSIASSIATEINNNTDLQGISVSASSASADISISSSSTNTTTYQGKVSAGATETITLPISVTISGTGGANFFYTTDGSTPTTGSTSYTGAFDISTTTTVKAIEEVGGVTGPVTTSFIQIDTNTANLVRDGLMMWLKSDNGVVESSGAVSAWNDISGNGLNATQATASNKPTFVSSSINGLPALSMDGTSDFLQLPSSGFEDFTAGMTAFVVTNPNSSGTYPARQIFDLTTGSNYNRIVFSIPSNTNGLRFDTFNAGGAVRFVQGSTGVTFNTPQLFETSFNGTTTATLFTNGLQKAQNTVMYAAANVTRNNNALFRYPFGSNYYFGQVAEILMYNRELTASERRAVELYLLRRYNLPLFAPVVTPECIIKSSGSQTVTMSTDLGNSIMYTTDGSEPTPSHGTLYTGSFPVSSTAVVKAISVSGSSTSPVANSYIAIDSDTTGVSRTGLSLWLRSDNGAEQSNAQTVKKWFDSSGNGMNAEAPSSSNEPAFEPVTTNSRPAVVFNGSSSYLQLPSGFSSLSSGMTLFCVFNSPSVTAVGGWPCLIDFTNGVNNAGRISLWQPSSTQMNFSVYNGGGSSSLLAGVNAMTLNSFQLVDIVHNGSNTATMATNSVQKAQSTFMHAITATTRTKNAIGQFPIYSNAWFNGKISEIILYDRALSPSEVTAVRDYLGYRYAPNVIPATGVSDSGIVKMTSYSGDLVHYTDNDSTPTSGSPVFTTPFTLTDSTILKASTNTSSGMSPIATSYVDVDPTASPVPRTGLSLWLRPNFGLISSSGKLSKWIDLSGSFLDATQSDSDHQPTVLSDQISELPVVNFDGSSSYLQLPQGLANFVSGATAFVVTRPTSVTDSARFFDLSNGASGNGFRFYLSSPNGATLQTQSGTSSTNLNASSGVNSGRFQLLELTHNGSGTATIRSNATQVATSSSMNNLTNILRTSNFIGSDYSEGNLLNGDIAEMLIYKRNLSGAELSAVESYLLAKYQLFSVVPPVPTFSLSAGALSEPSQVAIFAPAGVEVRFTLDGSTPGPSSTLFESPIQINYTTTVKAIAIKSGVTSSVSTATYTLDSTKYPAPDAGDTTQPIINLQAPIPAQ